MSNKLSNKTSLGISQAAVFLGVSKDTLRRWEKIGKIQSIRTPGGHRRYSKVTLISIKNKVYKSPTKGLLSIGEASKSFGISKDTLRRWEKIGKIQSIRTPGGHRRYSKKPILSAPIKKEQHSPHTTEVIQVHKPQPFTDEFPNLYDQLPSAQKKIIKAGSFMTLVMLLLFVFTRFGPLRKDHVSQ